jgi:uncharacterized RDD family membrane protein YckC
MAGTSGRPRSPHRGRPGYRGHVSDTSAARASAARQAGAGRQSAGSSDESYPGQQFGLPEEGPRSVAGVGRRLGALIIDWLICLLITASVLRVLHHTTVVRGGVAIHHDISFSLALAQARGWTLAVFAAEVFLLTTLTGFTIGMRVLGIRVARLANGPAAALSILIRTVLLLLVVPPLVLDKDLRGLHDRAARTVVIRAGG